MRSSAQQVAANAQYEEFMRTLQQPSTTAAAAADSDSAWSEVGAAVSAASPSTFTQIPMQRIGAALPTTSKFTWKQKQAKMHKQQQQTHQSQPGPLELQPLHPTLAAHRPKTIQFHSGGVQLPPSSSSSFSAAASSSSAAAVTSSVARAAVSGTSSTAAAPSPKRARVESASSAATTTVASPSDEQTTQPTPAAAAAASSATSADLDAIPSASSSSFRSYCVLIRNIPGSFHTADLRHFFSDFVESGRFKCFQPTHRRDEPERPLEVAVEDGMHSLPSSRSASPTPAASAAAASAPPTRRFERIPASISLPSRSRVSPHRPWKVMVQLRKRSDVQRLFADYQDREWVSHKGLQMGSQCRLRFVPLPKRMLKQTEKAQARASMDLTEEALDLTDAPEGTTATATAAEEEGSVIDLTDDGPVAAASSSAAAPASAAAAAEDEEAETADELSASREILAAYSAGEFQAPAFLPSGLVGTPSAVVRSNLAHLPPSLVRRLALPSVASVLTNSKFAYKYKGHEDASTLPSADADDDDDRLAARSRARAKEDLETPEEWDRDMAQSGTTSGLWDSGRGLGKLGDQTLFEEECANPWDKGDASGLVHYTDAAREEAQRGTDIDERNIDMWAVSDDDDEAPKGPAANARDPDAFDDPDDDFDEPLDDSAEGRARRKAAAAATMATRMSAAVSAASAASAAAAAAAAQAEQDRQSAWSRSSFLSRVMAKQGYTPGQGLGKKGQGIAQPIEAVNRGSQPIGLGFKPELALHSRRNAVAPAAGSAADFHRALQGKVKRKTQQSWADARRHSGGREGQGKRRWDTLEKE